MIEKLYAINITEQITEAEQQEIITKDNLNAKVSAQVYYKVKPDNQSVVNAFYNVNNYKVQIIALARTTLRNVIGDKGFSDVNNKRSELNNLIRDSIQQQIDKWGIDVVRVELKEIEPPPDVQANMNNVLNAQKKKEASLDLAQAAKNEAEGFKLAAIQKAEGFKQAQILEAEGKAQAIETVAKATAEQIKLVNTAASTYFKDQAVVLKKLEVTQASLQNNAKIIISKDGISPTLVVNEGGEIVPVKA
jgi:regulator of protease activity HflC (stomatin/prohibitin superfamily)